MQEQAPDSFFVVVSFYPASCLSLGDLVQRCLGQPVDLLAPWPSAAVIPRRWSTAVHFQSVECRVQMNLEGLENLGWTDCRAATLFFFFFFFFLMLTRRRRGLRERGGKILRWRPSNFTHYDACRRETAWVFPETLRSASGNIEPLCQAQSVSQSTDWTSRESKRTPRDSPIRLFLYPVPSAAAQTAPNSIKERASSCLVFHSLNTTSPHRMFSMGYRRAKSTQGNPNFQKRIFLANNFGITTAGLKKREKVMVIKYSLAWDPLQSCIAQPLKILYPPWLLPLHHNINSDIPFPLIPYSFIFSHNPPPSKH